MVAKDLVVTGDAKILGNLYTKGGAVDIQFGSTPSCAFYQASDTRYTIAFEREFAEAPIVLISPGVLTSSNYPVYSIGVAPTTTGFTLIFSSPGVDGTYTGQWVAIGKAK